MLGTPIPGRVSSNAIRRAAGLHDRPRRYPASVDMTSRAQFDALVEEATVDSNG